ncbi:MAG TPA: Os1348 family NHLP clan protein [Rhodopseudomonas sp.]|uniref:Os1348 family NHLP clan protein n=1 Tax=Rhodopseudomonas sp. TaxID=1078 RepID=UPI002ED78E5E
MADPATASDRTFSELVGRIFSDEKFAQALESNPAAALRDAGYKLDDTQVKALNSPEARNLAAADPSVAAFVSPVVRVLTKGTKPAVNVVVSSAVVASASQAKDRD